MRTKDPKRYNTFIQSVVNDLGIEYVNIHWRAKLRKMLAGEAHSTGDMYIKKGMKVPETLYVLAHELAHIKQYKSGRLTHTTWDGNPKHAHAQIYRGIVPEGYHDQPWEQEADSYARYAMNRFTEFKGFTYYK